MRILMLGSGTSLGTEFFQTALTDGHPIETLGDDLMKYQSNIQSAIGQLLLDGKTFDWIVNCYGTNQLDAIGNTPFKRGSVGGSGFANSMLLNNVTPIYWVVDALVKFGHRGARVLSIASQTYRVAQTNTALYCASKAALVQMSKVMARELASRGWVINCLAPGKIEDTKMAHLTDEQVRMLRGWSEEEAAGYALRNIPMRRFTNCAEVVEAMMKILFLPSYINGTCIDMTGGA